MSDRMAALERVAEAVRAWFEKHDRGAHANPADMRAALDALPAEPVGDTVEVRGCVGVDERGEVYGYCSSRDDDDELRGQVESCDYQPTAMFTIRVPKSPPPIPTVAARVEG